MKLKLKIRISFFCFIILGTWGLKKIVGDANVPDGELTIRTRCIPDSDSSQTFSAQIQVADFGFKDNK